MVKKINRIIEHYENCFEKHGDSHLGVDWPNIDDANKRYKIMLDLLKFNVEKTNSINNILDFGCGTSLLLDYINENKIQNISYSGLDISSKFYEFSKTI